MIREAILIILFCCELFWNLGFGIGLALDFCNKGVVLTISKFFNEFKKMNILGAICFIVLGVASIPAIGFAILSKIIISIIECIYCNSDKLFYKKGVNEKEEV